MPNVYLMSDIEPKMMAKLKDILKKHNVSPVFVFLDLLKRCCTVFHESARSIDPLLKICFVKR